MEKNPPWDVSLPRNGANLDAQLS